MELRGSNDIHKYWFLYKHLIKQKYKHYDKAAVEYGSIENSLT